ncbi:unnamed protein product [Polarella glacialis]|uniref:KHDC4/BBP-like KH-domain type I domain-containing protein n=1 Tax=Polarella glacialis TaxID=89957 RepID=A0A813E2H4_POLGL|nr:unnamed protein product [Polarella glacialis]
MPAAAKSATIVCNNNNNKPSEDQASLSTGSDFDGCSWNNSPTSSLGADFGAAVKSASIMKGPELPYASGPEERRRPYPHEPHAQLPIPPPPGLCLNPPVPGLCLGPPVLSTSPDVALSGDCGSQLDPLHHALWQEAVAAAAATYEQRMLQHAWLHMWLRSAEAAAAVASGSAYSLPFRQLQQTLEQYRQRDQLPQPHVRQQRQQQQHQQHQQQQQQREMKPSSHQRKERGFTYTCKFLLSGMDPDRDAEFELVPRLIGRQGCNTRFLAEISGGKVRVRGRGSQHLEERGPSGSSLREADVPLQITLSTTSEEGFGRGKKELQTLLDTIASHFARYCRRKGIHPVPELYSDGN